MKRFVLLLLSAVIILGLVSCGKNSTDTSKGYFGEGSANGQSKEPNGNYVALNDIVFSSDFFEGLAIVALKEDQETYYVIDKTGKIIFSISNDDLSNNGIVQSNLQYASPYVGEHHKNEKILLFNGIIYEIIYDKLENSISPEDVGATSFLSSRDGYIVAEKITSDYATTKKELGILNMDLEWISPLSEETYNLYRSAGWEPFWNDLLGTNESSTETFDFNTITNHVRHTNFVDGKAGVIMENLETRECYVSVIDTQGNFLFAPTKFERSGSIPNLQIFFDGNIVVVSYSTNGTKMDPLKIYSYNLDGETVGTFDTGAAGLCQSDSSMVSFSYSDGVIVFRITKDMYSAYYRRSDVRYYTVEFNQLF